MCPSGIRPLVNPLPQHSRKNREMQKNWLLDKNRLFFMFLGKQPFSILYQHPLTCFTRWFLMPTDHNLQKATFLHDYHEQTCVPTIKSCDGSRGQGHTSEQDTYIVSYLVFVRALVLIVMQPFDQILNAIMLGVHTWKMFIWSPELMYLTYGTVLE